LNPSNKISPGEITPASVYFNRRAFIRGGILAASAVATGLVYRRLNPVSKGGIHTAPIQQLSVATNSAPEFRVTDAQTSLEAVTHYNNFYEFSTDKEGVAPKAAGFVTKGWQVSVEGLVRKPKVFAIEDLLKISPPEERVYRMRCVEGWSMVIPWAGFSLSKLLEVVEPTSDAKFVANVTGSQTHAGPARRSVEVAVCGRFADG
jgi:methionine sulfoxide reductase catalytic subunit